MNVLDGKYTGPLTPEQTITQFKFRIEIHETYDELVQEDPETWSAFGSHEWHQWAINGYKKGIYWIKECNPVRCSLSEAFSTIIRMIFRR